MHIPPFLGISILDSGGDHTGAVTVNIIWPMLENVLTLFAFSSSNSTQRLRVVRGKQNIPKNLLHSPIVCQGGLHISVTLLVFVSLNYLASSASRSCDIPVTVLSKTFSPTTD